MSNKKTKGLITVIVVLIILVIAVTVGILIWHDTPTFSPDGDITTDTNSKITEDNMTQNPDTEQTVIYEPSLDLSHRSTNIYAYKFKGEFDSVVFSAPDGLILTDGASSGQFTSDDVDLDGEFTKLVASWNATSNLGTVEICVQVKKSDGSYSEPFSWGVWSDKAGVSGSANTKNRDGSVGIDILTLNEKCSGTVRFTVKLTRSDDGKSPVLRCVTLATDKTTGKLPTVDSCELKLDIPRRLQGAVPEIGGVICSPTSVSMVLESLGEKDLETVDAAWGVYDNSRGLFGNWSFNVAYAGEKGYHAIFDYYDTEAIKYALSKGTPVICSVKIPEGSLTDSGYPERQSNGHLLVVIGHTTKDGEDWFIINDPAVQRGEIKLLVREFETIWPGGAYIIQKA